MESGIIRHNLETKNFNILKLTLTMWSHNVQSQPKTDLIKEHMKGETLFGVFIKNMP